MTPLEGSILKWEKICKDRRSVDNSSSNCPLCIKYDDCKECPVHIYSGNSCSNTPYNPWSSHQKRYHRQVFPPYRRQKGCKICDELAQKELDFLRNLKP